MDTFIAETKRLIQVSEMTNEEMLAQMQCAALPEFHSFRGVKSPADVPYPLRKAYDWIRWLIANSHAERMEGRPWEVVLK